MDWGTERKFSLSLYSVCDKASQRFHVSSAQRVRNKFAVEHYAGLVEYNTENWLDKNKDQLPAACAELLVSSDFELMAHIKVGDDFFLCMIQMLSRHSCHSFLLYLYTFLYPEICSIGRG